MSPCVDMLLLVAAAPGARAHDLSDIEQWSSKSTVHRK